MALDAEVHADWIFQIDSDHQLETTAFRELWDNRAHYDLLLAERKVKVASLARRCLSRGSRKIVHGLFGRGVTNGDKTNQGITDVNTPTGSCVPSGCERHWRRSRTTASPRISC